MKTTSYKAIVKRVIDVLEDNGDYFFSTGNDKQDYNILAGVIKTQGYYAGVSERYYFNDDFELIKIESRF